MLADRAGHFYPIIDAGICQTRMIDPVHAATACFDAGARLLQLRVKTGPSGSFLALADAVVATARPYNAVVVINDRADIARMAGAGGVHVGQEDLPPDQARAVLVQGILGVSTHDERQVDEALLTAADYIAVGPIYATGTKATGFDPRGLALVRYASARGKPVVAIGGITLDRAPEVLAAGASLVAVISDLLEALDIEARTREWIELPKVPKLP